MPLLSPIYAGINQWNRNGHICENFNPHFDAADCNIRSHSFSHISFDPINSPSLHKLTSPFKISPVAFLVTIIPRVQKLLVSLNNLSNWYALSGTVQLAMILFSLHCSLVELLSHQRLILVRLRQQVLPLGRSHAIAQFHRTRFHELTLASSGTHIQ